MNTTVVTGGAGFIGSNLVRKLTATGSKRTRVLDDLSTGRSENLDGVAGVDMVVGSILDDAALDTAFDGATAVVHLAARPSVARSIEDPLASHEVNATGTLRVLEAARRHGVEQVIVASSSSVYGDNPVLPRREDAVAMPLSPYAASKLATEAYALSYAASFGLGVLAFRFFNVFGPMQPAGHAYAAVVPAFVDAALAGRPLSVHGDGEQTRDFTFVGTVCDVITRAIDDKVTHSGPVNLALGSRTSINGLVALLGSILGRELAVEHTDRRTGDVRDSQADPTRLLSLCPGIEPVDLETGLRETVSWYRDSDPTEVHA